MFEFIQRFFGKPTSSATAKERLRLVLLSDHLSLAPDVVEALKHDLIEVISRYVDVDAMNCDVTFEQQDKQVAMLANIPILGMRARPRNAPMPAPPPARAPEPEPVPSLTASAATANDTNGVPAVHAADTDTGTAPAAAEPAIAPEPVAQAVAPPANGRGKRRRRRQSNPSPATSPGTPGFSGI